MKKPVFVFLLSVMAVSGCKKDDDKTTDQVQGTFGGKTFYLVDAGDLKTSESSIQGSGSLVFAEPLSEISSADAFVLKFALENSGSIELVTHSNSSLGKGVSVALSRSATTLNATLKADTAESEVKALEDVNAAEDVSLIVDVHNDEDPTHILVWKGDSESFGEDNALINSEDGLETPGQGSGTVWGIVLKKATLKLADLSDPKFVD